jgi:hypothetical protein
MVPPTSPVHLEGIADLPGHRIFAKAIELTARGIDFVARDSAHDRRFRLGGRCSLLGDGNPAHKPVYS